MALYNGLHVRCAAITQFNSLSVKNFVERVANWEVFINQVKELLSKLCFQCRRVGWCKPDNITFSLLFNTGFDVWFGWAVFESCVVSTFRKGLLVVFFE